MITKKQSDQIEAIQKTPSASFTLVHMHDMLYTSAIFLADLPTMSDQKDQLARKLFKFTIHPTSSLHNLLPPPRKHPSIIRLRVLSKFPRIPTRTKKYQSFLSVCEITGGQEGVRPPKSMRDPCKVVICRDPGGSHKNPLIVNCLSYYLIRT